VRASARTSILAVLVACAAIVACETPARIAAPPRAATPDVEPLAPVAASAQPPAVAPEPEDAGPPTPPPNVGDACKSWGRYVCAADAKTALFCNEGVVVAYACAGPKGCSGGTSKPSCDDDYGVLGEPCMQTGGQSHACSMDSKSALRCDDGKWALWRYCRDDNACSVANDKVNCDNRRGNVGDPCGSPGSYVCAMDGGPMLLICHDRKLIAANSCRGPKGCRLLPDNKNHCDDSMARSGDACDTPDEVSCSEDAKTELVCRRGKYVVKAVCTRKGGCEVKEGQLYCKF
jgi:hypothetical protein